MLRHALIALGFVVFAAGPAVAASEGGSGNLFAGDVGNAVWTLLIFGLVVFVLGKFAWGPILGGLKKREEFIFNSLRQAKLDREEAEGRLKEYVQKLEAARAEASAIVDEGRRDAEVVKRQIEEKARQESDAMLARARREIAVATDTAVKELYTLGGKLATEVASKIIRKELSAAEHQRLISESIDELAGKMSRN